MGQVMESVLNLLDSRSTLSILRYYGCLLQALKMGKLQDGQGPHTTD